MVHVEDFHVVDYQLIPLVRIELLENEEVTPLVLLLVEVLGVTMVVLFVMMVLYVMELMHAVELVLGG